MGVRVWGSHTPKLQKSLAPVSVVIITLSISVLVFQFYLGSWFLIGYAEQLTEHLANMIFRAKEILVDCGMLSDKYL